MTTSSRSSPERPGTRRTLPATRPESRGGSNTEPPVGGDPATGVRSTGEAEHDNEAAHTAGHRERDAGQPGHGNTAITGTSPHVLHARGMQRPRLTRLMSATARQGVSCADSPESTGAGRPQPFAVRPRTKPPLSYRDCGTSAWPASHVGTCPRPPFVPAKRGSKRAMASRRESAIRRTSVRLA